MRAPFRAALIVLGLVFVGVFIYAEVSPHPSGSSNTTMSPVNLHICVDQNSGDDPTLTYADTTVIFPKAHLSYGQVLNVWQNCPILSTGSDTSATTPPMTTANTAGDLLLGSPNFDSAVCDALHNGTVGDVANKIMALNPGTTNDQAFNAVVAVTSC
jgi:hypothetical protein